MDNKTLKIELRLFLEYLQSKSVYISPFCFEQIDSYVEINENLPEDEVQLNTNLNTENED